jgi:hypothetical protein
MLRAGVEAAVMLLAIVVLGVALALVVGAIRIMLGWVLPRGASAAIDRVSNRFFKLLFQLIVVALGAGIIALVVVSLRESAPAPKEAAQIPYPQPPVVAPQASSTSPSNPSPDACDPLIANVVQATDAAFERRSPSGEVVFFKHPAAEELTLQCPTPIFTHPDINAAFDGSYPPGTFFDLIALTANAALGLKRRDARAASVECHRQALGDKYEVATVERGEAHVECQAFTRDGGATSIGVFWKDAP